MWRSLAEFLRLSRWLDVRPGEWSSVFGAFAVLLLIVAGHTALETARDALLLEELPPAALGGVYLGVALLTLPLGLWTARRSGGRLTLAALLVAVVVAVGVLFVLPQTRASAVVLYILTGLIGALVVPQFWAGAGRLFTVAQGRRLLGPIAAAGMIGGVVGSSAAAALVMVAPVRYVMLLSAGLFVAAVAMASGWTMRAVHIEEPAVEPPANGTPVEIDHFPRRIALLVVLSTATLLSVDYLFKWTVAATVPAAQLGDFFARTYMVLNVLSLIMQLVIGSALLKRLGVAAAVAVTPAFLLLGTVGTLLSGGALAAVLLLKGTDGTLRHSVHRLTSELLYLPLPRATRERVKPLIDGVAGRAAQAATAAALLALAAAGLLGTTGLALIAAGLALLWLAVAVSTRTSYLATLRRTLAAGRFDDTGASEGLDLAAAEVLVEALASRDPLDVIASLRVLAARQRGRLIPALILYHPDERVLLEALQLFTSSERTDWLNLAEPLLEHKSEAVRQAAMQAVTNRGRSELVARLARDASPRVRAYAAAHLAMREAPSDPRHHPALSVALAAQDGGESVRGLYMALADLPPARELADVLVDVVGASTHTPLPEEDELLARAAARQRDARLVPVLLDRLPNRLTREAVREALVTLGKPAFDEIVARLADRSLDRQLRKHLPRTLARFGSQRAAELLLLIVEMDSDGLVRFKALRGLGRLVEETDLRVDRARVERLALKNAEEHLRLIMLRSAVGRVVPVNRRRVDEVCDDAVGVLLGGLLDDKASQALERTFRMIKIRYPHEDLQRVHYAARSRDARGRANAAEFLETLLAHRPQQRLRSLLALSLDDLPIDARALRAAALLGRDLPRDAGEALVEMMEDSDATVAALAAAYAQTLEDERLRAAVRSTYDRRPLLKARARELMLTTSRELAHV